MHTFTNIFKKIKIRGSGIFSRKKAKDPPPSQIIPPDRTNAKESYAVSRAIDLVSEGPIEGLVDRDGRVLLGEDVNREFETPNLTISGQPGLILKNFNDKFLNKSYKRNTEVKKLPKASKDIKILLIMDFSSSMNSENSEIANSIEEFVKVLRAGPYNKVKIAMFGQSGQQGNFVSVGFTDNYDSLRNLVIENNGQGSGRELHNANFINAINAFGTADEVVILTDERGDDPLNLNTALNLALSNGVRVHCCQFAKVDEFISFLGSGHKRLVDATNGTFNTSLQIEVGARGVFREVTQFIADNAYIKYNYESFTGASYGLSKNTEVFTIIHNSSEWLISNLSRTETYWILSASDDIYTTEESLFERLTQAESSEWIRRSGSGSIGKIINYNSYTLDRGVFFDDVPLKTEEVSNFSKYKLSLRKGGEFQEQTSFIDKATTLFKFNFKLLGPFVEGGSARSGTGNSDQRRGGNFAQWRNYTPIRDSAIPFIHEISHENVGSVDINMVVNQLFDTQATGSVDDAKRGNAKMGRRRATTINLQIKLVEYKKDGTKITTNPTFNLSNTDSKGYSTNTTGRISLTGLVTSAYEFTIKDIELPEHQSDTLLRQITVEKIDSETLSTLIGRQALVSSIAEKNKFEFYYPLSALVASEIDARAIDNLPTRTFALKGKKILIPSNYFPIDDFGFDRRFSEDGSSAGNLIYDGTWDGTFKLSWSDNPAWILYDLLTNYRYGTATYNRELDKINIWSLFEIGKYCDAVDSDGRFVGLSDGFGGLEPRYSFNQSLNRDEDAYKVIKDISKTMRALAFYQNSQIQFRIDKPEDPVLFFNNLNVRDGLFTYSDTYKTSRMTAVNINFLDKRNNYRLRSEYVEDEDGIQKFGYNRKTLDGFATTSRGQALRSARAALFQTNNETETVSFECGHEGLFLQPGDIIKVEDQLKNIKQNFGKFLGVSGFHEYTNGPGFTAFLVDKELSSITGLIETGSNITLCTARDTTKIKDLYDKKRDIALFPERGDFISDEDVSGLKNPQISKFQLDTGTNFIEEFDDHLLFRLNTGQEYPIDVNDFFPNSHILVQVSGRSEKHYKVLNVEENADKFYSVGAIRHHTGKFEFIEKGENFDKDLDSFDTPIKTNIFNRPNKPLGISTGTKTLDFNEGGAIDIPIFITGNSTNPGDQFALFLTKPNGQTNTNPILVTKTGDVTSFTLQDLKQIGIYELETFSRLSNVGLRSQDSTDISFNLNFSDFNFDTQDDNYLGYKNISLDNAYDQSYLTGSGAHFGTGEALNAYPRDNNNLFSRINLDIIDRFGDSAFNNEKNYDIDQKISARYGNLVFNQDGTNSLNGVITEVENFKNLNNDEVLEITTEEILSGIGYTGDGRFKIKSTLDVEIAEISGINFESGIQSGSFAGSFTGTPVLLFNHQFISGEVFNDIKPLVINEVSESGFKISSFATGNQDYKYVAVSTGDFQLNRGRDSSLDEILLEVRKIDKTGLGFQQVNLSQDFLGIPAIHIQSQDGIYPSQTYVTGVTKTGFAFDAINLKSFKQTGSFGYLAIDTGAYNINEEILPGAINYRVQTTGNFVFGTGNEVANVFETGADIDNIFSIIQPLENQTPDTFSTFNSGDTAVKLIKQNINSETGSGILANGSSGVIVLSGQNTLTNNIGIEDFSIFFNLKESTTGKSVIVSKFLNSGFEVFSKTGDLKLHMSDTNGNSGIFNLTTGVGFNNTSGRKNHCVINVDRNSGVRTFVNGQENFFNTGITEVTGNLSNNNEISFLGDSRGKNPDHGYSLFNLNGNSSQFVVDVAKHGTNLTGSFTANDIVTGKLLEFVGVAGIGTVSKLYDQFGDKDASQTETGNQPTIVSGGAVITLRGKPAMQFTRSDGNLSGATVLNIKTNAFGDTDPGSTLTNHISGVSGLETFALASFDTVVTNNTNTASAFIADFILGENYSFGKRDFGIGAGKFGSDDARLYLYHERDQDNTFGGFSIDEDTDNTKDGFGYSGNIISVGNDTRYLINAFAGLNTGVGSGFIGIGSGSDYVSGFVSTGRNNYLVGTIGSDQSFDKSFQGKLQEILFYTSTFGFADEEREKVKNNINKKLAQSDELDYLTNEYSNVFTDYIGITKDILTEEEIQNTQFITGVQNLDNQISILDLSLGTGNISNLTNLSDFVKIKNNITNITQEEVTSISGNGDFNFVTITGTNFGSLSTQKVQEQNTFNFVDNRNLFSNFRKIFSVTGESSVPVGEKMSVDSDGNFLFVGFSADQGNTGVVRIYDSQNGNDIQQITGGLGTGRLGSDLSAKTFFDKTVLFIGNQGSGQNDSDGQIHMFHQVGSEFVSGFTRASGSGIGNVLKISNSLFTGDRADATINKVENDTGILVSRGAQAVSNAGTPDNIFRTGVLFIDKITGGGSGLQDLEFDNSSDANNFYATTTPLNDIFANRSVDGIHPLSNGYTINLVAEQSGDLSFGESFDFNNRYLLASHTGPIFNRDGTLGPDTLSGSGFVQIYEFNQTNGDQDFIDAQKFTVLDETNGLLNKNNGFAEGFNSISINDNNIAAIISRRAGVSQSGFVNIVHITGVETQLGAEFITGIDLANLGLGHSRMTKLANEDYTFVKITNDRLFVSAISGNSPSTENDGAVHIFEFSGSGSNGFNLIQSIFGFSSNFGVDIATGDNKMLYVADRRNNTVTAFKDERVINI
jgi:hypothetical protein